MLLYANAKINLGLNITEKRSDGFHNIESLFVPVDWSDEIRIHEAKEFEFTSEGIDIPQSNNGNHCIQAFDIIQSEYSIPNVKIHLKKNIPIGAGLGGGSSDAAFVLKGLNQLFSLNIGEEQLEQYSNRIGSDCPFFIKNKPAYVYGTGNKFDHEIALDFNGFCALIYPNIFISTKEAYSGIMPKVADYDLREISSLPRSEWSKHIHNDFEGSLKRRYPQIDSIKKRLYDAGAFYTSLSGSGSTVYGLFEEQPQLVDALKQYNTMVCRLSI